MNEDDLRNAIRTQLKHFNDTIPHAKVRLQRYKAVGHESRTILSDTIRLALQPHYPPDVYTADIVNSLVKHVITMDESNSKRILKKKQQKEMVELALREQRYFITV